MYRAVVRDEIVSRGPGRNICSGACALGRRREALHSGGGHRRRSELLALGTAGRISYDFTISCSQELTIVVQATAGFRLGFILRAAGPPPLTTDVSLQGRAHGPTEKNLDRFGGC